MAYFNDDNLTEQMCIRSYTQVPVPKTKPEYALLLEAALGTDANIWIGLQADYNMQKIKQDKSFMKRIEKIRKIAAIF